MPRLILPETDELAAVYEDEEGGGIAIIGSCTGDYDLLQSARAQAARMDRSLRPEAEPVIGSGDARLRTRQLPWNIRIDELQHQLAPISST